MNSQGAESNKRIRVQRPAGSTLVVKWPALIAMLHSVLRQLGWQLQIDGASSMSTDVNGGIQAKINPGSAEAPPTPDVIHPYYIYQATGLIHAGTINGSIPTLGGSAIGETGNALTLSGDMYVYLKNVWSLTFSSTTYLLTGASLTSKTIVTESSPQSDSLSGSTFTTYQLIAQVIDGKVVRLQQTRTSLSNSLCDLSSGSSDGKAVRSNWNTA